MKFHYFQKENLDIYFQKKNLEKFLLATILVVTIFGNFNSAVKYINFETRVFTNSLVIFFP